MTKKKTEKKQGGMFLFSYYVAQITILAALAAVVSLIYLKYPLFWKSNWIPISIIAGGISFLALISLRRDFRRNYLWIATSLVFIIVILIVIAWLKSILSVEALERSKLRRITLDTGSILYVEHPTKILFDSANTPSLKLWITGNSTCPTKTVTISSRDDTLLFAPQEQTSNQQLQWHETLEINLPSNGNAQTVLFQASNLVNQETQIALTVNGFALSDADLPTISWERKNDVQIRFWQVTLLDTSSIV